MKKLHFVGIGGNGMSALAQIYAMKGDTVTGSDRFLDNGITDMPLWNNLKKLGIKFYPQNANAVTKNLDGVVLSTAITKDNPEYIKAKELNIPLMHRSEILAECISNYKTIAVCGTSGKSTTTAMIFEILKFAGLDPSLITGGALLSLQEQGLVGNVFLGKSDIMVIEADESDGTLVNYHPEIAVMLNLTKDHKDMETLETYFKAFKENCKNFIVNGDEENLKKFANGAGTFSIKNENEVELKKFTSEFKINKIPFTIPLTGLHNVSNAMAAVSVCSKLGVSLKNCSAGLAEFKGVHRRFNSIGRVNDIEVIDDFAHNPAKISASISSAKLRGKRVIAFYQPHGYLPVKLLEKELVETFADSLSETDILYLSDIYKMGGTPIEGITSENLCKQIKAKGANVFYVADKENIIPEIVKTAKPDDVILIMGARDPILSNYAHKVLKAVKDNCTVIT